MADGFELYHVPQQSRRDKLRIPAPPQNYHDTNSNDDLGLIPSYDPGLLTCAGHRPNPSENPNFTGFPLNPQNPNPSDSQFLYPANNREFDDSSSRQGLSLSLSSPGHPPMEVNFHCPAPPGPFTGYTCILKGSVFLRPARLILQEMCEFGGSCSVQKMDPDPSLLDPPTDESYSGLDDICATGSDGVKSRLISMLVEVYRRYKQYSQQLQAAVATFESIPGLNNAAPFTNFALTALSKHFKCLKTAITDQLQLMSEATSNLTGRKHRKSDENDNFALCSQIPVHNGARTLDSQPVWRPQRGLPERSVSVLRAWLFEHFLHPYPTDSDKMMLAKQTGLSRNQVSNWFINARVRLWKPMVEEIHALETRQQVHQVKLSTSSSSRTEAAIKVGPTNRSLSGLKALDSDNPPEKRVRNELVDQLPQFGGGNGNYSNVNGGVSLTLALHQNNHGMSGLLDPYPCLALAHCYELSSAHEDDRGFQPHNTQFSTREDVMTGQISRDFIS